MFSVGKMVVYGVQGICKIDGFKEMAINGEKKKYYILSPAFAKGSTIYVPTDNEALLKNMRPVLSKSEIDQLIDNAAKEKIEWIDNDFERHEFCTSIIKSGERMSIMQLIEMLYLHREALKETKKHFHISDDRFLREAERLINDEFSFVLGIPQEQVADYILNRIKS